MKKIIETELVSLAHKILQMKDREDTKSLLQLSSKIYDKLLLLNFYEENQYRISNKFTEESIVALSETISQTPPPPVINELEEVKEEEILEENYNPKETNISSESEENSENIEEIVQENSYSAKYIPEKIEVISLEEETKIAPIEENNIQTPNVSPENNSFSPSENQLHINEPFSTKEELPQFTPEEQKQLEQFNVVIEDSNILEIESVFNPDAFFEEATSIDKKEEFSTPTSKIENTVEKTELGRSIHTPIHKTINDSFNKNIVIGLNDRIAFEKNLFNGKSDDLNRVISQLNTFDTYQESIDFIEDLVKPDFNYWKGKEEYEERLLDLITKRFV